MLDSRGLRFGTGAHLTLEKFQLRTFPVRQAGLTVDDERKGPDGKPIRRVKYGMHALRRAAASLFIEQGFMPKRLQAIMGHSTIQLTFDCYGHLFPSPEADREAMAALQARLLTQAATRH
jgi:integrase